MEEILKELIKTTLEKGPQNKQFYSNLNITKPLHDQAEVQLKLGDAISFLRSKFQCGKGFQSKLYTSRNCAIESVRVSSIFQVPDDGAEVLTSVLALDLLFNSIDNEHFVAPYFQEIICNFSEEILDTLHNLIVPCSGISTFNLFKQLSLQQSITPVPSGTPSPDPGQYHAQIRDGIGDFDSGNDSPTSMLTGSSSVQSPITQEVQDLDNIVPNLVTNFPDDINTSMITLYVLLHQGILQAKPVESVLRWIISNVFSIEDVQGSVIREESCDTSPDVASPFPFPTFITKQGNSDPIGVTNVLNLMYPLDISHEVVLNAAEEFLVSTLKETIAAQLNSEEASSDATPSSSVAKLLGNTQNSISSTSIPVHDNGLLEEYFRSDVNETAKKLQHSETEFVLRHHSPDSLLYFLSRALAIAPASTTMLFNNVGSNGPTNCRRPYISEMKSLLLDLLDVRLGTTMNTCDLAMRILSGVYLDVVMVSNNTSTLTSGSSNSNISSCGSHRYHHLIDMSKQYHQQQQSNHYPSSSSPSVVSCDVGKILRINNLLQKEFELLVSLQNDADGSWQADSLIQVGMYGKGDNGDGNSDGIENDNYHCLSNEAGMTSSYLGGRELATLFAVKAISVFLSSKKGTFFNEREEGCWGDFDNVNGNPDQDLEIHHLY